ncbi:MAG: nucleoside kinase [Lachnospiraceae bacterium]|nr:nucleoside kinase [Lachnospiraceae bacterium]
MPKLTIHGEKKEFAKGTTYETIAKKYQKEYEDKIALVTFDGKIRELIKKPDRDGTVEFLTLGSAIGHKSYERTAIMMLIKALHDVSGSDSVGVKVEFSIGHGCYCTVKELPVRLTAAFIKKVQKRMEEIRDAALPITKKDTALEDAVDIFRQQKMDDKVSLFRYRSSSWVNIYQLDGFFDYYYGFMLPNTSYVSAFRLEPYHAGILMVLPPQEDSAKLHKSDPREQVFSQMELATQWGDTMGVQNVADLNDRICAGDIGDLILVQEALFERRIASIAWNIAHRDSVKFVMISGPSSSGKTTFAHRISVQLRTFGLKPHLISLDNYFKNREDTPLNADGSYNFECLEAMDVEQFNEDMVHLLNGERVMMPTFNFLTGQREMKGNYLELNEGDILVIEGIHGLNEKMSYALPASSKYKVYISALTTLNIDDHNRIPTTDGRLLRRMVRDARTRGASAHRTIGMWKSVRAGEEEYIFPFQESADEMFNSAAIYELAVLKQYAEPLLYSIKRGEPEYYEAKRLLKFLDYFIPVDSSMLPMNSICREFVGGSLFNV